MKKVNLLGISLIFIFVLALSGCGQPDKKTIAENKIQNKTKPTVATQQDSKTEKDKIETTKTKVEEKKDVIPEPKKAAVVPTIKPKPVTPISAIDCGTNFQCLINAAKDCKMAKVKRIDTSDLSAFSKVIAYDHKILEIKGYENKKCLTRFLHEKTTAKYSNPAGGDPNSAENIKYANKEADVLFGYSKSAGVLEIKCKFANNTQLVSLLEKWNKTKEGLQKTDMTNLGCMSY